MRYCPTSPSLNHIMYQKNEKCGKIRNREFFVHQTAEGLASSEEGCRPVGLASGSDAPQSVRNITFLQEVLDFRWKYDILYVEDKTMNYATRSPKLQAYFEEYYERMQATIALFQQNPVFLEEVIRDRPHVLKRFNETAAMSREELMLEIEADYFLFCGCMPPGGVPR